ncbi:MAG TPA: PH domain-containing protein [Acidimicrobiales bacterium]
MPPDSDRPGDALADTEGAWHRLHPFSPVMRAGRLLLLGIVLVADDVIGELARGRVPSGGAAIVAVLGSLGVGVFARIAWTREGFRLVRDELEIRAGIVFRSRRTVPVARIESVDVHQPLLARFVGLVELRVEAASSGRSEVSLKYLDEDRASAVRSELLALRNRSRETTGINRGSLPPAPGHPGDAPGDPPGIPATQPEAEVVARVANADLITTAGLPFAVGAVIAVVGAAFATALGAPIGGFVVVVVFSGLSGAAAAAQSVNVMWDFQLGLDRDGFVVHRGLLSRHHQRIVMGRIQAIRVEQPLLWRLVDRSRIRIDIAGYRGSQDSQQTTTLMPVAPPAVVAALIARITAEDLTALERSLAPAPRQARWCRPLGHRALGVVITRRTVVSRWGLLRRRLDLAPIAKQQSLRVRQGPWQRRFGLATVHLDTPGTTVALEVAHRPLADAIVIVERSRRLDRPTVP